MSQVLALGLGNHCKLEGFRKLRGQESVLVRPVSCSQENVMDDSLASIVQIDSHLSDKRSDRNRGPSESNGYVPESIHQPPSAGRWIASEAYLEDRGADA